MPDDAGGEIVIEGACDEIVDATGNEVSSLTTPERAEQYVSVTGVLVYVLLYQPTWLL